MFLGLLQTAGLRTAEASTLSGGRPDVLSAGVGRAVLARGASGRPFLPLPVSGGPGRPSAWGCITPVSAPVLTWPLLRICVFTFSVSLKTLVTGFRVCLEHPDDLISRSLSISSETLISNKPPTQVWGLRTGCVFFGGLRFTPLRAQSSVCWRRQTGEIWPQSQARVTWTLCSKWDRSENVYI